MKNRVIFSLALLGLFALGQTARCRDVEAQSSEKHVLHGHAPAQELIAAPIGRLPGTNSLHLAISLDLHNREALAGLLQRLYDPASPDYRQYLTPEQFTEQFGPTAQDYQAVIDFAKSSGLVVDSTHDSRLVLDVRGKVSDIEKAFHVRLRTYQHPSEARQFYAPDAEPWVDASLPILDVAGLSDYTTLHPANRGKRVGTHAGAAGGSAPIPGDFMGQDFRNAYVPGVSLQGTGQTVGLFEADGYYAADIENYEAYASLPAVPLKNVLIDGFNGNPGAANAEVAVDIEMAISMAPELSAVVVFETSTNDANWIDILDAMASSNQIKQFSSSWGYVTSIPSQDPNTAFDTQFQKMAAQGQSFFQASGDGDAWVTPIWVPADSVYVTSVGGTSLTMSGPGVTYTSETVWNSGSGPPGWPITDNGYWGSGGGVSTVYPVPYWQTNVSMALNQGSTANRNIPDVAMIATNVFVTADNGAQGSYFGTSCSAPLWAGFAALVNQQAASSGKASVGFLNPAIYALGEGANYSVCFHDITTGNNISGVSPSKYSAATGYDLCTGWGTPAGSNLVNALAGIYQPSITSPPASQTNTVGGTATFTVTAAGVTPLSYQWQFDGATIAGATHSSLVLSSLVVTNSGSYTVVVTNQWGSLTSGAAVLTVNQASPTVTWANPVAITYGAALTGTQLNATANVGGNFAYTPASGTILTAGTNTLSVVFTPTDTVDYSNATNNVNLVVSPASLTITATNRTKTYGQTVTFPATGFTTIGLVNGNTVTSATLTSSGSAATAAVSGSPYSIVPSGAAGTGLTNYNIAYVNGSLSITAKALTMSGLSVPPSKIYDGMTVAAVSGSPGSLQTAEAAGTGSASDGKPYTGDAVSLTGTATGTYNSKDVATATSVTFAGVSLTGAQAGDYTLTIEGPVSAAIAAKALTMSGLTATASKVYNGTTTAAVSGSPGSLQSAESGGTGSTGDGKPYTGDSVSLTGTATGTYNSKDVATATSIAFAGVSLTGAQAGDYTLTIEGPVSAAIAAKALTMSGLTATASMVYNGTTTAAVSGSPGSLQPAETGGTGSTGDGKPYTGDLVSLTGTATGTYNSKDVATATSVTFAGVSLTGAQAGDYTLTIEGSVSAAITAKALTMSGLSAPSSMVYNGTTTAAVSGSPGSLQPAETGGTGSTGDGKPYTGDLVSLTGTATGTYNSKDVATATSVTFAGVSLTGAQAGDYTLTIEGSVSAAITAKALTMSGLTAAPSMVYNGTTTAAVSGSPGSLQPAETGGTGSTGDGKPYTGDLVSLTGTATGTYNSKDVATATSVTFAGVSLTGAQAGDYTLTIEGSVSAAITAKALTMSGLTAAPSKVYNGTTAAAVSGSPGSLQTAESGGTGSTGDGKPYTGDTVSLTGTATGTYNSKNVATATTVTFGGVSLTGTQAGDYTLTIESPAAATITQKALTMSGLTVPSSMVYNGTTTVAVSGSPGSLQSAESGGTGSTGDGKPYTGDTVSLTGTATGTYNSKDVATATTVTFGGVSLTGTQAGDYTLTIESPAAATITQKALTMSGLTVPSSMVYNGTTTVAVSGSPGSLQSAESGGTGSTGDGKPYTGDTVSLTGTATGTYNSKDVATATSVTFAGVSLTGAQAGDYTLTIESPAAATITQKALTMSGLTVPSSMVYNGTTTVAVSGSPGSLQSAESGGTGSTGDGKPYTGDTVSLTGTATGTYNSKDVATATSVTFAGVSLTGAQAGDYTLTIESPAAATITQKALTMSGLTVPSSMVYNGTTAAAVSGSPGSLQPAETGGTGSTGDGKPYTGDTVSLTGTATGTYNSKDVATATSVTFAGVSLTGTQAGDYTLTIESPAAATITQKALTMSGLTVPSSMVYNGTTAAAVSGSPGSLQPAETGGTGSTGDGKPYTGDTVSLTGTATGTYNSKDVATATSVTFAGVSLAGAQAGDYALTIESPQAATISPVGLTITADNANKIAGQTLTLGTTAFTEIGLVIGDTVTGVTLTSTGAASAASAGGYPIVPSEAVGTGLANYTIAYVNGTLTVTPSNCDAPPSGLVSWWKAEGNTIDNFGGNSGTLENGVTYVTGEVGQAFDFNSDSAMVVVGTSTNLQLQNFAIEAWIQRGSATAVSSDPTAVAGNALLFSYGTQGYGFGMNASGSLSLNQIDVSGVSSSVSITDTAFHHVAVTESSGTVVFYVDGAAYPVGSSYNPTFAFTTPAAIAGRADNLNESNNDSFLGVIDEMSIYNRALTATEVSNIYNAGTGGKCLPALEVTWGTPSDITYSTALSGAQLDATANVPGTFTYIPPAGTGLPAGQNQQLSVTFNPSDTADYPPTIQTVSINVDQAPLTITASPQGKIYGVVLNLGTTAFTTTALFNSDTVAGVTLGSPGAAGTAAVGGYVITPSLAVGTGVANYNITYNTGALTVTAAPLTITASPQSKIYGAVLNLGTTAFTTAVLFNSDTVTGVALSSPGVPGTAPVEDYLITPSLAVGTGLTNYNITYDTGALTVTAAPLTITASPQGKIYGAVLNLGTTAFTTTALFNSDTVAGVALSSPGVPGTAPVEGYLITPSFAVGTGLGNYNITYDTGALTVTAAPLTITASPQGKIYGAVLNLGTTAFTTTVLSNSDTVTGVTLASPGAAGTAAVESYLITPSFAVGTGLGNYNITYDTGALTVTAAPLTITASPQSKTFGTTLNLGTTAFTTTVLSNSDTVTGVTLSSPGAVSTAADGNYLITPSAAVGTGLGNYDIFYQTGMLTVSSSTVGGPIIQSAAQFGDMFVFTWGSATNQTYQIQSTTNLAEGAWSDLGGPIVATNSTATATDFITNSQMYYRVVLLP